MCRRVYITVSWSQKHYCKHQCTLAHHKIAILLQNTHGSICLKCPKCITEHLYVLRRNLFSYVLRRIRGFLLNVLSLLTTFSKWYTETRLFSFCPVSSLIWLGTRKKSHSVFSPNPASTTLEAQGLHAQHEATGPIQECLFGTNDIPFSAAQA